MKRLNQWRVGIPKRRISLLVSSQGKTAIAVKVKVEEEEEEGGGGSVRMILVIRMSGEKGIIGLQVTEAAGMAFSDHSQEDTGDGCNGNRKIFG